MSSHIWEAAKVPLDSADVIAELHQKLYNIGFVSEDGHMAYPVEVERVDIDTLLIVMPNETKFILSCKEKGE